MLGQVVSGLALGCVYALVALGFSLIYAAFSLPHFAQGDILMLGGVVGFTLAVRTNLGLIPILMITAAVVGTIGVIIERLVYRKIMNHDLSSKIVCTVNVGVFLQNAVSVFWSNRTFAFPTDRFGGVPIAAFGQTFPPVYLNIFAATALLVLILTFVLQRTRLGLGMRATAYSHDLASLMGVNIHQCLVATFAIGAGLAGTGGVLVGQIIMVVFTMGAVIGLKGYVAAVLGGFGSIPGALVGGLLLGVFENLACFFISSAYKDAVALILMILILILRPQGLLGRRREVKV